MSITIKGTGCLVPVSPVPDAILALAYPCFTVEEAPDGGLWLTLSPYPEVYDEDTVQAFLRNLIPYIARGHVDCMLEIAPGHVVKWSYRFVGPDCYRSHSAGSCTACSCINR
jgi:hypothetical protein